MIPINQMVPRGVYRIHSRNLVVGVWNGKNGFIGIREKFRDKFLFTEYHWETGTPYGTAKPLELITTLPEDIELREMTDPYCDKCGQPTIFKKDNPEDEGTHRGLGTHYHADMTSLCDGAYSSIRTYKPLFDFLEPLDKEEIRRINKEYDEKYGGDRLKGYIQRDKDADKA